MSNSANNSSPRIKDLGSSSSTTQSRPSVLTTSPRATDRSALSASSNSSSDEARRSTIPTAISRHNADSAYTSIRDVAAETSEMQLFITSYPLEKRKKMFLSIIKGNAGLLPVLIRYKPEEQASYVIKFLYLLFEPDTTFHWILSYVRSSLGQDIVITMDGKSIVDTMNLRTLYTKNQSEDGFLYLTAYHKAKSSSIF